MLSWFRCIKKCISFWNLTSCLHYIDLERDLLRWNVQQPFMSKTVILRLNACENTLSELRLMQTYMSLFRRNLHKTFKTCYHRIRTNILRLWCYDLNKMAKKHKRKIVHCCQRGERVCQSRGSVWDPQTTTTDLWAGFAQARLSIYDEPWLFTHFIISTRLLNFWSAWHEKRAVNVTVQATLCEDQT